MARRPGDDRQRRLADVRLPDARRPAVLRRHLLPARAAPRPAVVPAGARGRRAGRGATSALEVVAVRPATSPRRSSRQSRLPDRRRRPRPKALLIAAPGRAPAPRFDTLNGGWGGAPKFPQPMTLDFLLRRIAGGDPTSRRDGPLHARSDGRRRDPRPARRRLPPLRDRPDLARPALRADALRQRPARPDVPARVGDAAGATGRRSTRTGRSRSASSSTCSASSAATTARSPRARTPTPTASRARRSPGPPPRSDELLGDEAPRRSSRAAYGVRDEGNWEGRTILSRLQPAVGRGRRRSTRRGRRASRTRGRACSRGARRGRSRRATTRRSPPGTGWRSARSPTPRGCSRSRPGRADALPRRPRSPPPTRSSPGCAGRTAGSAARGRTAGRPARASSRTTPTSPTACSPCTRRPSTSAGSSPPASSPTRSSTTSRTRPAASSTRPTTTRRSSPGRRTRRTTRRRRAARWRRSSCSASPR